MEELIKQSFLTYLFLALFLGIVFIELCFLAIKKAKIIPNFIIRIISCIVICCMFVFLWVYFFVYINLYPISLAYSEYNKDLTEESVGVVDNIEQEGKDRIHLIIDDEEYIMVYSSSNPFANIGTDIVNGDCVKFKYGEKSKYIFDIYEVNELND